MNSIKKVGLLQKLHIIHSFSELVPPKFLPKYGTQISRSLSKEELINKIKTEYPSEWNTLMKLVKTETTRYNLLFDRCNVYIKIK
jgi:hypothetical protein